MLVCDGGATCLSRFEHVVKAHFHFIQRKALTLVNRQRPGQLERDLQPYRFPEGKRQVNNQPMKREKKRRKQETLRLAQRSLTTMTTTKPAESVVNTHPYWIRMEKTSGPMGHVMPDEKVTIGSHGWSARKGVHRSRCRWPYSSPAYMFS